jgi:S-(hydroxymethyl)glutathione dehydrogenase/alcohol dehydrogenase
VKAAVLEAFGSPFAVEEVELLPPGPTEVVVRTGATVFCITDCINARGELGKEPPTILGHAGIGVVEEVGERVHRFRPGDRVVAPGTPECGVCYWCVRARPDQCAQLFAKPLHIANRADGAAVTCTGVGSYAEQMRLRETAVFPVESDLPDEQLCLLGCGITSGLGAVLNAAQVEAGSSVAIVGCGQLGLWMVQGARVAGAAQIIAVEPRADRRTLAGELGATDLVDPGAGDPVEQVQALTGGRGVDYALEAAGPPEGMVQAFTMARKAGTVVLTGVETLTSTITFSSIELALRGKDVRSSQNGRVRMGRDIPRFVRMIEEGLVDPLPLISTVYTLEGINEAARAADAHEDLSGVIAMAGP